VTETTVGAGNGEISRYCGWDQFPDLKPRMSLAGLHNVSVMPASIAGLSTLRNIPLSRPAWFTLSVPRSPLATLSSASHRFRMHHRGFPMGGIPRGWGLGLWGLLWPYPPPHGLFVGLSGATRSCLDRHGLWNFGNWHQRIGNVMSNQNRIHHVPAGSGPVYWGPGRPD
jgi:hypothetical protein